jgi:cobalamin biosynthetic protein CobC
MADSLAEEIDPRFFEHGGRLDIARLLYPHAPEPWIDLSTGISPWPYPALLPSAESCHGLPDVSAAHALGEEARRAYRAPPGVDIVALPGTDAGLSIIPWLFRTPKRVAILSPAYSGHCMAWEAAGHSVSNIDSLDRVASAAILVVVNPGNPDGRFTPHAELAGAVPNLKRRDGLLIVDEAFADAEENHSLLPTVSRLESTLVLRSLGKFYGAAGIRLGFAVTSHPIAARLRAALGAWPISAQAIAHGRTALGDSEWSKAQRARLQTAAADLDRVLTEAGFRILGGTSLFRLAGHHLSHSFFTYLAKSGILTRPLPNRSALRFGIPGKKEDFARLSQALTSARL